MEIHTCIEMVKSLQRRLQKRAVEFRQAMEITVLDVTPALYCHTMQLPCQSGATI